MRLPLAAWLALSALPASPAGAQEGPSVWRRSRMFIGFDNFRTTNSGDGFKGMVAAGARGTLAPGASGSGTLESGTGLGGRIGAFVPVSDHMAVGPSLGYLRGPNAEASLDLNSGQGRLSADRSVYWLRALTEVQMRFPLKRGDAAAILGAGLGVARGRVREHLSCAGVGGVCAGAGTSGTKSWTGITWELSPGFAYKSFLAGYRWAVFPSLDGTDAVSEIDWKTSEIFVGMAF